MQVQYDFSICCRARDLLHNCISVHAVECRQTNKVQMWSSLRDITHSLCGVNRN